MEVFYFFTGAFFGNVLAIVLLLAITLAESRKGKGKDDEK